MQLFFYIYKNQQFNVIVAKKIKNLEFKTTNTNTAIKFNIIINNIICLKHNNIETAFSLADVCHMI